MLNVDRSNGIVPHDYTKQKKDWDRWEWICQWWKAKWASSVMERALMSQVNAVTGVRARVDTRPLALLYLHERLKLRISHNFLSCLLQRLAGSGMISGAAIRINGFVLIKKDVGLKIKRTPWGYYMPYSRNWMWSDTGDILPDIKPCSVTFYPFPAAHLWIVFRNPFYLFAGAVWRGGTRSDSGTEPLRSSYITWACNGGVNGSPVTSALHRPSTAVPLTAPSSIVYPHNSFLIPFLFQIVFQLYSVGLQTVVLLTKLSLSNLV